jgi:hypothetical protein
VIFRRRRSKGDGDGQGIFHVYFVLISFFVYMLRDTYLLTDKFCWFGLALKTIPVSFNHSFSPELSLFDVSP